MGAFHRQKDKKIRLGCCNNEPTEPSEPLDSYPKKDPRLNKHLSRNRHLPSW